MDTVVTIVRHNDTRRMHALPFDCRIFCETAFSCMSKRAGQYFVGQVSAKSRPHKAMISVKEQQQNAEEDDGSFTPSSNALVRPVAIRSKTAHSRWEFHSVSIPHRTNRKCWEIDCQWTTIHRTLQWPCKECSNQRIMTLDTYTVTINYVNTAQQHAHFLTKETFTYASSH